MDSEDKKKLYGVAAALTGLFVLALFYRPHGRTPVRDEVGNGG